VTTPSKLLAGLGICAESRPKAKRFVTTIPHSSYEERKPLYVSGRTSAPQSSAACKKKGPGSMYWHILGGGVEPVCITLYRQKDLL